jgi:glycosyltransferase involved in cell wall biosynthesis
MARIAFISTNSFVAWAGSEELWSQTAFRMATAGHNVGVNVPHFDNEAPAITRLRQTPNIALHKSARTTPLWRRALNKVVTLANPDIDRWLAKVRPDVAVISQGCTTDGYLWMEACRCRGVPYVVISHLSADALWPMRDDIEQIAELYKSAAAVFFVSLNNWHITEKHFGAPIPNARIVRNPYQVPYDVQVDWPGDRSTLKLACVARLGAEHKGQDLLFEVMRDSPWRDRQIEITLFGEGHHRDTLKRLATWWGVDKIIFGGHCSDIPQVWATHHALIMPSRYEGLPLSLVEAMLCRRMAIVTDVGGHSELIEDGVNGFLVETPTARSLASALERAWQRREEWRAMGERAGANARRIIPADPVGVFAQDLEKLL